MERDKWDLFYESIANPDRVVVPLSGPGGKIAVLELKKPGRLPDGVMPALVHGTTIMDFQWDPFDNQRLAVGKVEFEDYNKIKCSLFLMNLSK